MRSGYNTPVPGLGRSKNVETRKHPDHSNQALPPKMSTVELKVPMCCEECEENVRSELTTLDGVDEIDVNVGTQKVIVIGEISSSMILDTVKKVKNQAELWRN